MTDHLDVRKNCDVLKAFEGVFRKPLYMIMTANIELRQHSGDRALK